MNKSNSLDNYFSNKNILLYTLDFLNYTDKTILAYFNHKIRKLFGLNKKSILVYLYLIKIDFYYNIYDYPLIYRIMLNKGFSEDEINKGFINYFSFISSKSIKKTKININSDNISFINNIFKELNDKCFDFHIPIDIYDIIKTNINITRVNCKYSQNETEDITNSIISNKFYFDSNNEINDHFITYKNYIKKLILVVSENNDDINQIIKNNRESLSSITIINNNNHNIRELLQSMKLCKYLKKLKIGDVLCQLTSIRYTHDFDEADFLFFSSVNNNNLFINDLKNKITMRNLQNINNIKIYYNQLYELLVESREDLEILRNCITNINNLKYLRKIHLEILNCNIKYVTKWISHIYMGSLKKFFFKLRGDEVSSYDYNTLNKKLKKLIEKGSNLEELKININESICLFSINENYSINYDKLDVKLIYKFLKVFLQKTHQNNTITISFNLFFELIKKLRKKNNQLKYFIENVKIIKFYGDCEYEYKSIENVLKNIQFDFRKIIFHEMLDISFINYIHSPNLIDIVFHNVNKRIKYCDFDYSKIIDKFPKLRIIMMEKTIIENIHIVKRFLKNSMIMGIFKHKPNTRKKCKKYSNELKKYENYKNNLLIIQD